MVLKNGLVVVICTLLLGSGGVSAADAYRPGQFLGLDLSTAVLSPKPLGPPTEFAPVPVEARGDRAGAQAAVEPAAHSKAEHPKISVAKVRSEPRHAVARIRLTRHHSNPLDAQAQDTRIQVWPCKSGGICAWKR